MSTSFDDLADRFSSAVRDGEDPDVEDWASRYPEHAEAIRNLFPTILVMEQMKSSSSSTTAPRISLQVGDRLGDFEIVREIGRGGMGVVFEAQQGSLDRRVALKVLPGGGDERRRQRFEREVRTAAKLHHTNIVPVFGVGEQEGWRYYVMPVIHGVSIDRVIARWNLDRSADRPEGRWSPASATDSVQLAVSSLDRLVKGRPRSERASSSVSNIEPGQGSAGTRGPESEAPQPPRLARPADARSRFRAIAEMARQAASGLAYAHQSGVLHRDIKPANLLLDNDGIVWITDFGLATASGSEELTRTGDVLGTVQYLAPEQLDGRADPRSDVFALGLTLYELCSGRPARRGEDRAQILREAASSRPERLRNVIAGIPRDLETIVHRACEPEPRHRYQSAKDLEEDLERFLDGRPIAARRTHPGEELWRWCQRNRLVASLAAAAVLGVLGGGSAAAVGWYRASQSSRLSEDRLRAAYAGFDEVAAGLVGIGRLGVEDPTSGEDGEDAFWFETSVAWEFTRVSDRERRAAKDLLGFYESLASEVEGGGDRELLARAFRRRGDLLGFLSETDAARSAYESALGVYREFTTDEGALARAEIWFRMANLELAAGVETTIAKAEAEANNRVGRRIRSLEQLIRLGVESESLDAAAADIESMRSELGALDSDAAAYQYARADKVDASIAFLGGDRDRAREALFSATRRLDDLLAVRGEDRELAEETLEAALLLVRPQGRRRRGDTEVSDESLQLAYSVLNKAAEHLEPGRGGQGDVRRHLSGCLRLAGTLRATQAERGPMFPDSPIEVVTDRLLQLEGEERVEAREALVLAASIGALNDFNREPGSEEGSEETIERIVDELIPAADPADPLPLREAQELWRTELRRDLEKAREQYREFRELRRRGAGGSRFGPRREGVPRDQDGRSDPSRTRRSR